MQRARNVLKNLLKSWKSLENSSLSPFLTNICKDCSQWKFAKNLLYLVFNYKTNIENNISWMSYDNMGRNEGTITERIVESKYWMLARCVADVSMTWNLFDWYCAEISIYISSICLRLFLFSDYCWCQCKCETSNRQFSRYKSGYEGLNVMKLPNRFASVSNFWKLFFVDIT